MKKILLFLSSLIYIFNLSAQDFFDLSDVKTIEINFSQNNWDDILDTYYTAGSDFRLVGSMSLNGVQFDSVGVRYKGNSSYNATNVKNPLNIKLDYVKGKQEINGRTVLKLSNVYKDPTFVREVLSYEIARKYMPASESNYANVYVNGTYIGLYVNDESTNSVFATNHYFNGNGPFFEGDFSPGPPPAGCTGGPTKVFGYLGTDPTCYEQYYALQSSNTNDWNELVAALDTFNNYTSQIENAFYIDRLLWMLALDNVMVNLDSPINPPHNFLLYKDKTDRFNPIMWDLNQSFGVFTGAGGGSGLTATQLKELSPWYNATNSNYPILTIPFSNDRYKKMYIAKMKTVFNENFNNDWYSTRIDELQSLISADVNADPNKFYTNAQFTQNVTATSSNVIGIEELMSARKTYLNSQADFLKIAPEVSNITQFPTRVNSNSNVTISAEITNANYVYLGYRFSPKDKFIKIPMTNSGNVYSATIAVEFADVQYYIWAENNDAGIFSPERAEYEFYGIGVTDALVINELQASNENTKFDEAAEYDDWIELFNNSNEAIDLTGYYLTDNIDTLTKWQIPAQSIAAHDYAIFWADKDIAQGANHTNFHLTRSGESLYLISPSQQIIDQITYPLQDRNLSYSRFPNGVGAFIIKEPTFKATNGGDTATAINSLVKNENLYSLYPNPNSGTMYVQSKNADLNGKTIIIYDSFGRKVFEKEMENKSLELINTKSLSKGFYLVSISEQSTIKLIIK